MVWRNFLGAMKILKDHKINPKCRFILLSFHKIISGLDVFFVAGFITEHRFYLIFQR